MELRALKLQGLLLDGMLFCSAKQTVPITSMPDQNFQPTAHVKLRVPKVAGVGKVAP